MIGNLTTSTALNKNYVDFYDSKLPASPSFGQSSTMTSADSTYKPPRFISSGRHRRNVLNFLLSLRSGSCCGVRIRLGRLQEMMTTSCIESLDFVS
jgi:hypothetical protein